MVMSTSDLEVEDLSIYPNPATNRINIDGKDVKWAVVQFRGRKYYVPH